MDDHESIDQNSTSNLLSNSTDSNPSNYGAGSQQGSGNNSNNEPLPTDSGDWRTALKKAVDYISMDNHIDVFYNRNSSKAKICIRKGIVAFGKLFVFLLLLIESLDNYEWVCVWKVFGCESLKDYNDLSIYKLLATFFFNICILSCKIESVL